MKFALLDIFESKTQAHEILSIQKHLLHLLNTRQGSLRHMPNFGLPDITVIYQGLPNSIDCLLFSLKTMIETYEPRLSEIIVEEEKNTEEAGKGHCVIHVIIKAILKSGSNVRFSTHFVSGGRAYLNILPIGMNGARII